MQRFRNILIGAIGTILVALAIQNARTVQSQQASELPAQVLVQEIRALRRSLDDYALNNSRLQFAVEHSRMQQLVVDRLVDEHNSLQAQLESNEDLVQQNEATVKNLDEALSREQHQERKDEMERDRTSTIASIAISKQRLQKLQDRIAEMAGALQSSKARLGDSQNALFSLAQGLSDKQIQK